MNTMGANLPENEIPAGDYCYRVVPLAPDEAEPRPGDRFGKEAREAGYHGRKRVLCPYWLDTDHGTIRCDYLGVEAVKEYDYQVHLAKAIAHFGGIEQLEKVRVSATLLTDELKICERNLEEDQQP